MTAIDPMSRNSPNLFLIAARDPVAGQTKTRLGETIGMERAATLYRAFLSDLAARFSPRPEYDFGWAFSPPDADFAAVLRELGHPVGPEVRFVPQDGQDWGTRQANILRWGADRGYERTVLIASDSPQVPASVAVAAIGELDCHNVVLGRVHDGGYYLIGSRGGADGFLSGVPMSTASAADALIARASALGFRFAELPATFDVDEVADLDRLVAELVPDGAAATATWTALHDLGLLPTSTPHLHRPSPPQVVASRDATGAVAASSARRAATVRTPR